MLHNNMAALTDQIEAAFEHCACVVVTWIR